MISRQVSNLFKSLLSVLSLWVLLCLSTRSTLADDISFHQQVVPLLTRAGCNTGACHGAAAGRGGFHLSLFGSNPSEDYAVIVHELEGRRVNRVSPTKSLLLRKPLGELNHGGDQVFDDQSLECRTIKAWIDQGARLDTAVQVRDLRVEFELLDSADQPTYQLKAQAWLQADNNRVEATLNLGTAWEGRPTWKPQESANVDVTAYVQFVAPDPDSVLLDVDQARVQLKRPGRHVVIARYLDRVAAITLSLPFPKASDAINDAVISDNFIDREVHATLASLNLPVASSVSDAEFLRRASLDLTGRLPDPQDVRCFLLSNQIDKRQRAIDRLLASPAFDDYWTLIFARWLHLHSLPGETQGVAAFGQWIRQCVSAGTSWREMTMQLLTATGDSHSNGPANFCRMVGDARAHAELVSEVFMGARLACANCHDHPLDRWTQDDYHGLAAMLARIDRGRHVQFTDRGDVTHPKTTQPAEPRLPGEHFVARDAASPKMLAQWLTAPGHTRLAEAFTNRIWREMFGRGLVEAVDDMRETNPATHPQLLKQLAGDVARHDFDLRYLLRQIAASQTYARQSSARDDPFYGFRQSKPLTAQVLADAIADVTGVPMEYEGMPSGTRAVQLIDPLSPAPVLDALGRCQRAAGCSISSGATGLAIQLHLINGELINRTLVNPQARLSVLTQHQSTSEIIQEFTVRALGQAPNASQLDMWVQQLDHQNLQERDERLQDWLWSILSSQRFQNNH